MIWLLEEYDMFDPAIKGLAEEVKKQGHELDYVHYYKMQEDNSLPKGNGKHPDDACVLFYGSIQCGRWIQRNRSWVPGCWYNWDAYKCSQYYYKLGKHLFNDDYIFMPYSEVKRRRDELLWMLGPGHGLFVRPDTGGKSFTGQVLEGDELTGEWDEAKWNKIEMFTEPNDMCVVAEAASIKMNEWRFVVTNEGEIVTGSRYKENGSSEISAGYEQGAYEKCKEILGEGYFPDPMFTIDICRSGSGSYRLVEIGNFCCAGLYAGDLSKIVSTASRLALKEHADFYP